MAFGHKITLMRPVAFGEALPAGTRLTLFSDDKPDRFFTVIKFWMDKTSGVALDLKTGVPTYQAFSQQSCHQGPFDLPSFRLERIFLVRNGKA